MTVRFNILAGCESGTVKGIDTANNAVYVVHKPNQTYMGAVNHLEWSSNNGQADFMQAYFTTKKNDLFRYKFSDDSIVKLGTFSRNSQLKGFGQFDENLFVSCSEDGIVTVDRVKDESLVTQVQSNAGPDICRLRLNPFNRSFFATGGKENDLKIWSIEELLKNEASSKNAIIFHAKNVRPNQFRLRQPVWVTDFQFVDERNRCLVATGHHQIRFYDPQSGARRPVHEIDFENYPIMSMALVHSSNNQHFVVGNTQGEMAQYDLKRMQSSSIVHKYRGAAGSIRSIDTHPTLPLIVSASIDQYVRIYSAENYQQTSKYYLKSALTSVLFSPHEIENKQEQQTKVTETNNFDLETDEVWSQFKRKTPKDAPETSSSKISGKKKRKTTVLDE